MRLLRILAGLVCIAVALATVGLLLLAPTESGTTSPALMAHLPPVAFGLALFALGLWLLLRKR